MPLAVPLLLPDTVPGCGGAPAPAPARAAAGGTTTPPAPPPALTRPLGGGGGGGGGVAGTGSALAPASSASSSAMRLAVLPPDRPGNGLPPPRVTGVGDPTLPLPPWPPTFTNTRGESPARGELPLTRARGTSVALGGRRDVPGSTSVAVYATSAVPRARPRLRDRARLSLVPDGADGPRRADNASVRSAAADSMRTSSDEDTAPSTSRFSSWQYCASSDTDMSATRGCTRTHVA